LAYTLFVVVFGAVVRITGSGAGCGQHWPTCHGEIVHLPRSLETAIELTHRVTSGLTLVAIAWLGFSTRKHTERGHPARRWALWSFAFLIVESLVGAVLVLFALVGQNSSWMRAVVMAVHLVNTSLLLGAIHGTALALSEPGTSSMRERPTLNRLAFRVLLGAMLLLVVSAAGAVTALGDTLYPVAASAGHGDVLLESASEGAHFLERLRGFHPLLAILAASYLLYVAVDGAQGRLRFLLLALLGFQLSLGVANIALGAPGWMQVAHLSVGTLLWLSWVHLSLLVVYPKACLQNVGE